jgi:Ser/Thr protein kinase RdoA (MazF antagonist)
MRYNASLLNVRSRLGEDLFDLVKDLKSSLIGITDISKLSSSLQDRACYRLECADKTVLKGRRFDAAHRAQRTARYLGLMKNGPFPKVIAARGRALLLEWIHGLPVSHMETQPEILKQIGMLQGWLHKCDDSPMRQFGAQAHQDLLFKTRKRISYLAGRKALTAEEAEFLVEIAVQEAPLHYEVGMIHKDLSPDNVVLKPSLGKIYVIDNETLGLGPYDFDLARTWHRWPMNPIQREAFYYGYEKYRCLDSFHRNFLFWAIAALVTSAYSRLRTEKPGWSLSIRKLRSLLNSVEKGESPSQIHAHS